MNATTLDETLAVLAARKDRWAHLPILEKLRHLDALRVSTGENAADWVAASLRAKGIRTGSPLEGEEWLSGPYALLSWINAARTTLAAIANGRDVVADVPLTTRQNGQVSAQVYPFDRTEQLLLHGYIAEVWMQPGVEVGAVSAGAHYRLPDPKGSVGLILGAGNISSIPPLDAVYKLFAEGSVVVVKMNPVNEYLGPVFERIFAPQIAEGFVRFVYGGADVGAELAQHPQVDTVHVTGSLTTHDAIVFGAGADGAARKAQREPLLDKPITSELGGVTPTIVVPGPWDDADFVYHAEHIATQKLHNSGFNCVAAQVLVLPGNWDGSARLISEVRTAMAAAEERPAYYPGIDDRHAAVHHHHDHGERMGSHRTLVVDIDASDGDAHLFNSEVFGPILATTSLPGSDPATFLDAAAAFVNSTLYGTLGAQLIIHPDTIAELGDRLEDALAAMEYGAIAVNAWSGVNYFLARAAWGAYPGDAIHEIRSGSGVVHNAMLFDQPQKTVVRGPFRPFPRAITKGEMSISPRPPWFVTNKTAHITAQRLTRYAADPKPWRLPGIFSSALRG